jgi:hypothetical protein
MKYLDSIVKLLFYKRKQKNVITARLSATAASGAAKNNKKQLATSL